MFKGCFSKFFPNSHRNWKMGILDVSVIGLLRFSRFIKELKNLDSWILTLTLLPNFSQFTENLGNWDFWGPLSFIFFQIEGIVFQSRYVCREGGDGGSNLWLNCQFSRKKNVNVGRLRVSLSGRNTVSKLQWG